MSMSKWLNKEKLRCIKKFCYRYHVNPFDNKIGIFVQFGKDLCRKATLNSNICALIDWNYLLKKTGNYYVPPEWNLFLIIFHLNRPPLNGTFHISNNPFANFTQSFPMKWCVKISQQWKQNRKKVVFCFFFVHQFMRSANRYNGFYFLLFLLCCFLFSSLKFWWY